FRRGDKAPEIEKGFDIREATIAAACASGDLSIAVGAKRYISGLWVNTKKEPYTRLFNAVTTTAHLWYLVQVLREVDNTLADATASLSGRDKLISIHGNRFILFCVFEILRTSGRLAGKKIEADRKGIRKLVDSKLKRLIATVNELFKD